MEKEFIEEADQSLKKRQWAELSLNRNKFENILDQVSVLSSISLTYSALSRGTTKTFSSPR